MRQCYPAAWQKYNKDIYKQSPVVIGLHNYLPLLVGGLVLQRERNFHDLMRLDLLCQDGFNILTMEGDSILDLPKENIEWSAAMIHSPDEGLFIPELDSPENLRIICKNQVTDKNFSPIADTKMTPFAQSILKSPAVMNPLQLMFKVMAQAGSPDFHVSISRNRLYYPIEFGVVSQAPYRFENNLIVDDSQGPY